jgi:putative ABC transport system permease protein
MESFPISSAERTHEFGVRIALGAQRIDVLSLVISRIVKTTVVGVLIGVAGSLALTRLIAQVLYGVTATDPLTYSLVSLLLITVAVAASYIPARRATELIQSWRCDVNETVVIDK